MPTPSAIPETNPDAMFIQLVEGVTRVLRHISWLEKKSFTGLHFKEDS